jgi:hypothetical protein
LLGATPQLDTVFMSIRILVFVCIWWVCYGGTERSSFLLTKIFFCIFGSVHLVSFWHETLEWEKNVFTVKKRRNSFILFRRTAGTGSFPGVKWPGRGVDNTFPSSAEVKERVELYLYSPFGPSWPVLRWTILLPLLLLLWRSLAFKVLTSNVLSRKVLVLSQPRIFKIFIILTEGDTWGKFSRTRRAYW